MAWKESPNRAIMIASIASIIIYLFFYAIFGINLGLTGKMIALIPILIMSVLFGMKIGAIAGFGISSAMSVINLISNLPEFDLMKAIVIAILTGIGGGMYGWLSDQRKFLLESERKFEEMIIKKEEKVIRSHGR